MFAIANFKIVLRSTQNQDLARTKEGKLFHKNLQLEIKMKCLAFVSASNYQHVSFSEAASLGNSLNM